MAAPPAQPVPQQVRGLWSDFPWKSDRPQDLQVMHQLLSDLNIAGEIRNELLVDDSNHDPAMRTKIYARRTAVVNNMPPLHKFDWIWNEFEATWQFQFLRFSLMRQDDHVRYSGPATNPNHPQPFQPPLPKPHDNLVTLTRYGPAITKQPNMRGNNRNRDMRWLYDFLRSNHAPGGWGDEIYDNKAFRLGAKEKPTNSR